MLETETLSSPQNPDVSEGICQRPHAGPHSPSDPSGTMAPGMVRGSRVSLPGRMSILDSCPCWFTPPKYRPSLSPCLAYLGYSDMGSVLHLPQRDLGFRVQLAGRTRGSSLTSASLLALTLGLRKILLEGWRDDSVGKLLAEHV